MKYRKEGGLAASTEVSCLCVAPELGGAGGGGCEKKQRDRGAPSFGHGGSSRATALKTSCELQPSATGLDLSPSVLAATQDVKEKGSAPPPAQEGQSRRTWAG
jgi:hypothetical protein